MKLPSFSMPKLDVLKIHVPAVPSFDMPKTPAAPSFNVPSKSAAPAAFDAPGESQEARDARAAAKKADFKDADSVARASITCLHPYYCHFSFIDAYVSFLSASTGG